MEDIVAGIIEKELGRPVASSRMFAGGQSDVYSVNVVDAGDFILKIARPGQLWRIEREAAVYPLLDVCHPELCGVNVQEGYMLMKSAGGMSLSHQFKQGGDCSRLFQEMGRLLRQLHETPLDDAPDAVIEVLHGAREEVKRIVRRDAPGYFARVDGSGDHRRRWPAFEAVLEGAMARAGTSRLLHGDYNTRQVILDGDGRRITAVIDFEYACLGDPVLELLRMEMSGIRGRADFYIGYDRRELEASCGVLFEVLDHMHDAIVAREAGDASQAAIVSQLHRRLDTLA